MGTHRSTTARWVGVALAAMLAASPAVAQDPGAQPAITGVQPGAVQGEQTQVAPAGVVQMAPQAPPLSEANDYPTVARADYVFGCMAANGETRQALERCSCSIDVIASVLPYDKYVEAETIMSVGRVGGEKTSMFKSSPVMQRIVADLRRAQAEAEIRCF